MNEQIQPKRMPKLSKLVKHPLWRLLFNSIAIIPVGIVLLLIQYGYIDHHKSGFYCNDPKLSFKYNGDTVSAALITSGALLIPFLTMVIVEYIRTFFNNFLTLKEQFKQVLKITYKWYGGFLTVLGANAVVMCIFKFSLGAPRPHFFDTCRPDKGINCTEGYIAEYVCTNKNYPNDIVIDSYRSFLSGHTSISVYAGLYTFWYIEKRVSGWSPRFFRVVLQLLVLFYSLMCSLTRITDHRHHWWDVLAGSILAVVSTGYVISAYCDNFYYKPKRKEPILTYQITNSMQNRDTESGYRDP